MVITSRAPKVLCPRTPDILPDRWSCGNLPPPPRHFFLDAAGETPPPYAFTGLGRISPRRHGGHGDKKKARKWEEGPQRDKSPQVSNMATSRRTSGLQTRVSLSFPFSFLVSSWLVPLRALRVSVVNSPDPGNGRPRGVNGYPSPPPPENPSTRRTSAGLVRPSSTARHARCQRLHIPASTARRSRTDVSLRARMARASSAVAEREHLGQQKPSPIAGPGALVASPRRKHPLDGQAQPGVGIVVRLRARAEPPQQSLVDDRQEPAPQHVGLDPHVQQAADGLRGAAGVERAQEQMPRAARPPARPRPSHGRGSRRP